MEPETIARINGMMAETNSHEIEFRTEYYDYLVREKGEKSSLQEHLDHFASLSSFISPVTDEAIKRVNPKLPFPAELLGFYKNQGSIYCGHWLQGLTIYSPDRLAGLMDAEYKFQRFYSLGLADMINFEWGNSRGELDVGSEYAVFTQEQLDYLNNNYMVVASWEAYPQGDANFYIYYDRYGRFGILYHNQDTWEIFHMLEGSPARQTWDQVVNEALDKILASNDE